jgi:hypothetical protein
MQDAVAERLSRERFRDISSLVRGLVAAVSEAFSGDESVHRFLSGRLIGDPVLNQMSLSGRQRIFAYYRDALLPLLPQESAERAEMLIRISFHILAAAILGKAHADDQTLTDLSWNVLGAEISTAAIAYLEASVYSKARY